MDKIREIVGTLSQEEKKEFRLFINRQKNKRQRKDRDLFDLLNQRQALSADELVGRLYENGNRQAYHALRKRLLLHLIDFIVLKRMGEDPTTASSIMGLRSLAEYLFDQGSDRLAWNYLKKAEKQAVENEQFDLLNGIYNLEIEKAQSEHAEPLEEIIARWQANKELADEDERANVAFSLIQKRLKEVRVQGRTMDFDNIIQQVLKDYRLTDAMSTRPGVMYKVMSISRSAILAKKDFYSFEPYVISNYHQLESAGAFTSRHHFYQLSLLYMVAHVLYRNKKFSESNSYLEKLRENLGDRGHGHYWRFYARYVLLLAANHTYSGENLKSVELLEDIMADSSARLRLEDMLNVQLNLSVYYFQQEEFRKANQVLHSIGHSDGWCEKKMGVEWVLRKNLIELIVQFELGNEDIAENRIRSVLRNFKGFLEQPAYQRVKSFLGLIRELINHPERENMSREVFLEQVQKVIVIIPGEYEDLTAMGFYAWIKSKMIGENYYQVLLDVVRRVEEGDETGLG